MKKNFKIKMTSLFLAIIFVIALPISISAQTVDIPSPNSEVQPQSFTREYTTYLTSSTRQVMSDGNWFGEELVIVRFTSSEGPTSISVCRAAAGSRQSHRPAAGCSSGSAAG